MNAIKKSQLFSILLFLLFLIMDTPIVAQDTPKTKKEHVEEILDIARELKDIFQSLRRGEINMTEEELEATIEEIQEKIEIEVRKIEEISKKEEEKVIQDLEKILENMEINLEEIEIDMKKIEEEIEKEIGEAFNEDDEFITTENKSLKVNLNRRPAKQTRKNLVLGFGPTVIIDNQTNTQYIPDINPWNSWSGYLGYQFSTRFTPTSRFGIQYGLIYKWYIMGTRENARVYLEGRDAIYIADNINYTKSKLTTHHFAVPLMLQISNSRGRGFVVGLGGYAGLRIGDTQKFKYTTSAGENIDSKLKVNYRTSPLVYGLGINAGKDFVRFYAHYDLSNVWKSDIYYDWNRVNFGLHLVF